MILTLNPSLCVCLFIFLSFFFQILPPPLLSSSDLSSQFLFPLFQTLYFSDRCLSSYILVVPSLSLGGPFSLRLVAPWLTIGFSLSLLKLLVWPSLSLSLSLSLFVISLVKKILVVAVGGREAVVDWV